MALVVIVTALVTLYTILRTPSFQKYAGRMVASYLSDRLETKVLLEKIRFTDWLHVEIRNLYIEDRHGNPLLAVSNMEVGTNNLNFKGHAIDFNYLSVQEGSFSLVTYQGDSVANLVPLIRSLSGPLDTSAVGATPWSFSCDVLRLEDMSLLIRNENRLRPSQGIDYQDMEFSSINLYATDLLQIGDSTSANIVALSALEKSGVNLKEFKGLASVDSNHIKVDGLMVRLNESDLDMDVEFSYGSFKAFNDFINEVSFRATMRDCEMNLRDIGYFAPVMFAMDNAVSFSGNVSGRVAELAANQFLFDMGYHTHFDGNVFIKGLPDIYTTTARVEMNEFKLFPADVANFRLPGNIKAIPVPEPLDRIGLITLEGYYQGVYNDFKLDTRINTGLGNVDLDIQLNIPARSQVPVYAGDIRGDGLLLGGLLGIPELGSFDIDAEIQGRGINERDLQAFANVWIENLVLKGHHYDRIVLGGDFSVNTFSGRCLVFDESLALSFDGLLDFSQEHPVLQFAADLEKARFHDMNLSDRGEDMELSGKFQADFTGIDPDSFTGEIRMDSLTYIENRQLYTLEHFMLSRIRDSIGGDIITLRSDYADADAKGNFSIKFLVPQIISLVTSWKDAGVKDSILWSHPQGIDLDLHLKNTDAITDLFLEDLRVSNDANVSFSFHSANEELSAAGDIGFISFRSLRSEAISFNSYTTSAGLRFEAEMKHFYFNKSSEADTLDNLGIENLNLMLTAVGDSIQWHFVWDDNVKSDFNAGEIEGFVKIPEEGRVEASITRSNALVNGDEWKIEQGNYLVIDTAFVEFSDLVFYGASEYFKIDGTLSRRWSDTLNLSFRDWSVSNFSPVLSLYNLQMEGTLDGNIGFTFQEGAPNVFSNLIVDSLEFNYTLLGQTRIKTSWINDNRSLVVNMQIIPPGAEEKHKVLFVNGLVKPLDTLENFDLDIVTQNLQLAILAPFLKSFSSSFKGLASGQLHMGGTFKDPSLVGRMKLQRTEMRVDYLNVTYTLSNELEFTEDAIHFKDIVVYDEYTNNARCSGTLRHDHFRDMYMDLTIKPENLLALNLGRYDNDVFYGTAYASGNVRIYGPFKDITIDTDVTTGQGTNIFIPLNYSVDVSQSDFIMFTDSKDSTKINEDYRVVIQGFKLDMGIGVRPVANVQIFLPSNMGSIKASGNGDLRLGVNPRGYLTLNGSYYIYSGLFTFSLEQLVSKRFEITRGSSIKWEGDMNSASVNIAAKFRTKTSLSGLGISMMDPSSTNRKVNVVVKIYMTENLFNPNLRFSIDFPNMDDQTRQTVYAVLDTTDLAVMNQQAISLLILNSFTYTGNSSTNPINSTAILANSLSNMLSSVSNNFDIGINYIPGDDVSSEEVEVALSTQLFNDRLSIDGNFGVPTDANSQNTSSIVGDVQVEYKLTSDGRFRVKAFNRSNDLSIINNDVPYTQGVGIFYRKDFNNLRELFSPSKNKKSTE